MKKWAVLGIVASLSLALSACSVGDKTLVSTNEGNITQEDLHKSLEKMYGKDQLTQLVIEKILEGKYKVSDKEINAYFEIVKNQYNLTTDADVTSFLQQYNYTNVDDFKEEQLKLALLTNKAIADYKKIKITDADLKKEFENEKVQVKASHILVADEAKAKEVIEKLNNGEKFADLAASYSTDYNTSQNGGELPWFGKSVMNAEFEKAAFSLEVGKVSEPVKSDDGYHIIKVTERKNVKFNDVKEQLKITVLSNEITQLQTEDSNLYNDVLTNLRKDAKLSIKSDDYKNIFSTSATTTTNSSN
jgi:foldase protein PrsA